MALNAAHDEREIHRAAAADLERVARARLRGRLSDDAVFDPFAVRLEPAKKLRCPVHGHAFFVAVNEKADRAFQRTLCKIARGRGREGSDCGFHIRGTAPVQHAFVYVRREGIETPELALTRRHHVGMAGEAEVRRGIADACIEIFDGGRSWLFKAQAMALEAQGLEHGSKTVKRAFVLRRDRRATHQLARKLDRIDSVHRLRFTRRHGVWSMKPLKRRVSTWPDVWKARWPSSPGPRAASAVAQSTSSLRKARA